MSGVDNAVVIVGMDLRIRRFTGAAERLIGLGPTDIGREVARLETFVGGQSLTALATKVIDVLSTTEREVQCSDRRWYLLRIAPYKTAEHSIRGAVIVLSDIDLRKRSLQVGRDLAEYAGQFLAAISNPLLIVDDHLRVRWANDAYYEQFGMAPEEIVGQRLPQIGGGWWRAAELAALVEETVTSGKPFRGVVIAEADAKSGASLRVSGSRLPATYDGQTLTLLNFGRET